MSGDVELKFYRCSRCCEQHDGPPLSYHAPAPDLWHELPEAERATRAELDGELCVVDRQHYFIYARICLPIQGGDEWFEWGVWVSLSAQSYLRTVDRWNDPNRAEEPPCFGWLSTALPYEPSTLNLKTMVHTRPPGERPTVELEPTEHPLALDQRKGITRERIRALAETLLHGERTRDQATGAEA